MDLLNQLKTLRDNTNSPEVRTLCESHIKNIQEGTVTLNESEIIESVNEANNSASNEVNPMEMLRKQELEKSKSMASRLMESWGGLGSSFSKTSGSYVDGKTEEKKDLASNISESLSQFADNDPAAKAFVQSQGVNNLGVYESILSIKGQGIYEHPNVKVLCEKYTHLIKSQNLPEFLVAESFASEIQNFTWDNKVKSIYEKISESLNSLKPEIEVSKALYSIERNAGSDFYSPVTESLNKWLVSENKSVALLSKELSRWSFNPAVRNLVNSLSLMESSNEKLSIPVNSGNSSVSRLFSPVLVGSGKTTFTIGSNVFEGNAEGIRKLSNKEISELPKNFMSLLESFYSPMVKVNESGISYFIGDKAYKLVEENDSVNIYSKGNKIKFADNTQLAKQIALEISGTFGINESKAISDLINIYENFDQIVELDFAKRLDSKVYEGASVNLIKWENKLYLNKINSAMNENSLYVVNGTQASSMIKEFLKYDISEGLTEFLDGENRIKSIMINDRAQIIENITIVEKEIQKIEATMSQNPVFTNSKELQRAKSLLEQELNTLRQKWSAVNEEIEKIDSGVSEVQNVNEDEKFNVGDYIKVKESGNTGKIISVDSTSGSYTVLMDNGKTGDYRVDEIVDIEEALADAGKENDEKSKPQEDEEEIKENEMASAPTKATAGSKDMTPAATMKANTTAAPSSKEQEVTSKKDVENLDHANLEEAPEGKEKETKFEVKLKDSLVDKIGYNVNESDLEKTNPELAEAPGGKSDADYKVEISIPKANNPEASDKDQDLADAPESGVSKVKANTDQNLATAPGGESEADYKVEVTIPKANKPEANDEDQNLADAPAAGTEAQTNVEVNSEMGYNIDESEESKKN